MRLLNTFPNYETMPEDCAEFIHRAMTEFSLADNPPPLVVPPRGSPVLAVWNAWVRSGFTLAVWNGGTAWLHTRESSCHCRAAGWSKGVRHILNDALRRADPGQAAIHDDRLYGYPEPPGP